MATEVTFYKIPFINAHSRLANLTAIETLISNMKSQTPDLMHTFTMLSDTDVQPDVPFYFDGDGMSLVALNEYNYLSYTHDDYTYYGIVRSFAVSNQVNNKGKTTVCCYHHIDIFAMYGCGIGFYEGNDVLDETKATGIMTRGHVNDEVGYFSSVSWYVYPTIKYTFAVAEESVNTANLYLERYTPERTESRYMWLWIYVANPAGLTSETFTQSYSDYDIPIASGVLTVGRISVGSSSTVIYTYGRSSSSSSYVWSGRDISNLTSQYITAMMILPYNPLGLTSAEWASAVESGDVQSVYIDTGNGFLSNFNVPKEIKAQTFVPTLTTSDAPAPLFRGDIVSGVGKYYNFGETSDYFVLTSYVGVHDYYEEYRSNIVKLHTAPYVSCYFDDIPVVTVQTQCKFDYLIDVTLSTRVSIDTLTKQNQSYSTHFKTLISSFAPTSVQDYWTRLNATQESILAGKQGFNAVTSAINTGISTLASAFSGNAVGAINGMASLGASIGNAGYTIAYTSNAQELAQHQYETGITNDYGGLGEVNAIEMQDSPSLILTRPTNDEAKRIGDLLALRGYCSSLPLKELYKHQRVCYNYVQCADYERFDLASDIVEEFKQLFAQGVWIWHMNRMSSPYRLLTDDNTFMVGNYQLRIWVEDA